MTKEIFLSGMTTDQLSEMIRESLRDELRQLHPEPSAETPNYLTRRETARRLRISLVTLNDWVNRVVFQKVCLDRSLQILQICKYNNSCFQIHTPRRVVLLFVL